VKLPICQHDRAESPFIGPEPACSISGGAINWKPIPGLRQMKLLLSGPSIIKTRNLL
jgi:hypothetical protein